MANELDPITRQVHIFKEGEPRQTAVVSWKVPSYHNYCDRVTMTPNGDLSILSDPCVHLYIPDSYFEMAKVLQHDYHHPKGYEIVITLRYGTYRVVMIDNPNPNLSNRADGAFKANHKWDGVMLARAAGWTPSRACGALGMPLALSDVATWDDVENLILAPDYAKQGLHALRDWKRRDSAPAWNGPCPRNTPEYTPRRIPYSRELTDKEKLDQVWGVRGITYDRD